MAKIVITLVDVDTVTLGASFGAVGVMLEGQPYFDPTNAEGQTLTKAQRVACAVLDGISKSGILVSQTMECVGPGADAAKAGN
jgi:hypothetical protein